VIESFARLDDLPPLIEGGEVPARTIGANDPEPPLGLIEGDAPPNRKELEALVPAEVLVAVEAGGVDARSEAVSALVYFNATRTPKISA
jgi:hypothetical protein